MLCSGIVNALLNFTIFLLIIGRLLNGNPPIENSYRNYAVGEFRY